MKYGHWLVILSLWLFGLALASKSQRGASNSRKNGKKEKYKDQDKDQDRASTKTAAKSGDSVPSPSPRGKASYESFSQLIDRSFAERSADGTFAQADEESRKALVGSLVERMQRSEGRSLFHELLVSSAVSPLSCFHAESPASLKLWGDAQTYWTGRDTRLSGAFLKALQRYPVDWPQRRLKLLETMWEFAAIPAVTPAQCHEFSDRLGLLDTLQVDHGDFVACLLHPFGWRAMILVQLILVHPRTIASMFSLAPSIFNAAFSFLDCLTDLSNIAPKDLDNAIKARIDWFQMEDSFMTLTTEQLAHIINAQYHARLSSSQIKFIAERHSLEAFRGRPEVLLAFHPSLKHLTDELLLESLPSLDSSNATFMRWVLIVNKRIEEALDMVMTGVTCYCGDAELFAEMATEHVERLSALVEGLAAAIHNATANGLTDPKLIDLVQTPISPLTRAAVLCIDVAEDCVEACEEQSGLAKILASVSRRSAQLEQGLSRQLAVHFRSVILHSLPRLPYAPEACRKLLKVPDFVQAWVDCGKEACRRDWDNKVLPDFFESQAQILITERKESVPSSDPSFKGSEAASVLLSRPEVVKIAGLFKAMTKASTRWAVSQQTLQMYGAAFAEISVISMLLAEFQSSSPTVITPGHIQDAKVLLCELAETAAQETIGDASSRATAVAAIQVRCSEILSQILPAGRITPQLAKAIHDSPPIRRLLAVCPWVLSVPKIASLLGHPEGRALLQHDARLLHGLSSYQDFISEDILELGVSIDELSPAAFATLSTSVLAEFLQFKAFTTYNDPAAIIYGLQLKIQRYPFEREELMVLLKKSWPLVTLDTIVDEFRRLPGRTLKERMLAHFEEPTNLMVVLTAITDLITRNRVFAAPAADDLALLTSWLIHMEGLFLQFHLALQRETCECAAELFTIMNLLMQYEACTRLKLFRRLKDYMLPPSEPERLWSSLLVYFTRPLSALRMGVSLSTFPPFSPNASTISYLPLHCAFEAIFSQWAATKAMNLSATAAGIGQDSFSALYAQDQEKILALLAHGYKNKKTLHQFWVGRFLITCQIVSANGMTMHPISLDQKKQLLNGESMPLWDSYLAMSAINACKGNDSLLSQTNTDPLVATSGPQSVFAAPGFIGTSEPSVLSKAAIPVRFDRARFVFEESGEPILAGSTLAMDFNFLRAATPDSANK
jgi:hypothetical protein